MKNPLKEWREETGFTRSEAATALGFNYAFYCQIENGTQAPTGNLLAALAHVGKESDVCPPVDPVDFLKRWARYKQAEQRRLLSIKRDDPLEVRA